jgi:hypothetical protein
MRPAAGRSKWGQDPDTGRWFVVADRWHTGIVDAAGTGGLLGHIDGRTAAKVAEWIAEQPDSWRAGITHVTIDLSASYLRAVTDALPDAVVVADRFHLVRLANDMVTEVRQRATREVRGRRGRASVCCPCRRRGNALMVTVGVGLTPGFQQAHRPRSGPAPPDAGRAAYAVGKHPARRAEAGPRSPCGVGRHRERWSP